MSLNISKSFLEVENIKLSNQGKELNYKQIENTLTSNDELILQSLKKLKLSLESNSYSDLLLHTWNGFEFLAKSFNNSTFAHRKS